jgi:hypothetical protein
MQIVAYTHAHRDAVERMNAKLAAAGSEWRFSAHERPAAADELSVWLESFVAVDGQEAYGGYVLKHQRFFFEGDELDLGHLQLPLSLGEVDSAFGHVSVALLFDAIRRSPYLFSLGLGSEETQFARLLAAAGFPHTSVPFYFNVKSANRFAREIRLPSGRQLERALRVLGTLRLAGLALRVRRLVARRVVRAPRPAVDEHAREVAAFDAVADELFAAHAASYPVVADRRAAALRRLYPGQDSEVIRLVIERGGDIVGWAVVLDTQMRGDKYFGDLRVGSLVDCFAAPEDAVTVAQEADGFLSRRGVDIVVSNQLHGVWRSALVAAGYQRGPSNFFFYFSEGLASRLRAIHDWETRVHLNRGDGEGPGHLAGSPAEGGGARADVMMGAGARG